MVETGFFYGNFIDPLLTGMREKVFAEISEEETIVDIACGTGTQVLQLAKKAKHIIGVDLSESMVQYARKQLSKQQIRNAEFVFGDATKLVMFTNNEFDVAILSLALHQFPPEIYSAVMEGIKRVAKRVIIVDYAVPLPANFAGVASKIIEFLAGREHHRCFREYYKRGGLENILPQNGYRIEKIQSFGGGAFNLVVCRALTQ